MALILDDRDRAMIGGEDGPAAALAMRILASFADALGAPSLLDIVGAHIDGCLYHGQAGLDFVERLASEDGRVRVPTSLNVGSLDLIHPELVRLPDSDRAASRRLMELHERLGCVPTFTCAPYQTIFRPRVGDQIAWGESNAIAFANSVIGARTNRYGDFIDLCCAITGRAPAWGLHLTENRRGQHLYQLTGFPPSLEASDALYAGIGVIVGSSCGDRVPVVEGLPPPRDEDQMKALGAAAASAGSVGLFHLVGVTPEAPTRKAAFAGRPCEEITSIRPQDLKAAVNGLSMVPDGTPIAAICLGTPHFSRAEWDRFLPMVRRIAPTCGIPIYINTGRATLAELSASGLLDDLDLYHVVPVADTCTYITPILRKLDGAVMTCSAKWALYAPANLGVEVAFGDLEDCLASAAAGRVVRKDR